MIKILQVIDGKSFGGIAKLMFEVEKNISSDIKMDFLTANNIYYKWNNLNINRESFKNRIIYNYRLYKFLRKNTYDIIHINSGAFFFTFFVVLISKLAGIKKVIVHSHNTPNISKIKKFFIKILNPLYCKMIDKKLTCSKQAAKSLFTKLDDVITIKNGIDVEKFKFDKTIRSQYRKELNIDENVVYGNIARLSKQKNHEMLVDIFYKIQKKQDAILLLVGNGELEEQIKNKVNKLDIKDKVIFLGYRQDINKILNAIDVIIFPSFFEGLPVSLIEAQTNGLPVLVSEGISDETKILDNFVKIYSWNVDEWANTILNRNIKIGRIENAYESTIKSGYDIKHTVKQLEDIYKALFYKNVQ